jgi:hypothetical protein
MSEPLIKSGSPPPVETSKSGGLAVPPPVLFTYILSLFYFPKAQYF